MCNSRITQTKCIGVSTTHLRRLRSHDCLCTSFISRVMSNLLSSQDRRLIRGLEGKTCLQTLILEFKCHTSVNVNRSRRLRTGAVFRSALTLGKCSPIELSTAHLSSELNVTGGTTLANLRQFLKVAPSTYHFHLKSLSSMVRVHLKYFRTSLGSIIELLLPPSNW